MHGKETSLLQKRAATAEDSPPRKMRCHERNGKAERATAEESEAIAALEHFRNAGKSSVELLHSRDFCSSGQSTQKRE